VSRQSVDGRLPFEYPVAFEGRVSFLRRIDLGLQVSLRPFTNTYFNYFR